MRENDDISDYNGIKAKDAQSTALA